jgi:hypothetical protein
METTIIKKLKRKFRSLVKLPFAMYDDWKHRSLVKDKPVENVFSYIYTSNYWGDDQSASGVGSNEKQTQVIAKEIPVLFKQYNIKKVLDLPCGDFNWMRNVDLGSVEYIGGDIVEDIILKNQSRYGKPNISFRKLNIITDQLPEADLVFCRDCFVHLSNEQVMESIKNIRSQKIKYLLTTSHNKRIKNKNILAGEWRPINLEIPPFSLKPLVVIDEHCTEDEGRRSDKCLILIDLTK